MTGTLFSPLARDGSGLVVTGSLTGLGIGAQLVWKRVSADVGSSRPPFHPLRVPEM